MKDDYTHITMILDRTGSMDTVKDDTIGGFNQFLSDQKKQPGEATMTLVQFDSQDPYEVLNDFSPLAEVSELTPETYVPRGGTPLLDAIGRGINDVGAKLAQKPEEERPGKVIFVILTDGHENASREFNRNHVFTMIEEQRKKWKWEFVFLGANQDAIAEARTLGIPHAAAMTFAASAIGTTSAFDAMSKGVAAYRSAEVGAAYSFDEADRKKQQKILMDTSAKA
jgi:hypothetical protein